MNSEFLQRVKNYFTVEFRQQIGLSLDEETSAIDNALNVILPLGMAAVIQRVKNDNGKISSVFNMANSAAGYVPSSPDLAKLHNEEAGTALASDLFGSHERAVRLATAKYAGIKSESSGALILISIPVLMGSLGIYSKENNFTPDQLDAFVLQQEEALKKDIPDGVQDVGAIFGLFKANVDEKHIEKSVTTDAVQPKNRGWIIPVILAVLAVLLLVYFSRGCTDHENKLEKQNTEIEVPPAMILPLDFIH